jgi:hypothetical protein
MKNEILSSPHTPWYIEDKSCAVWQVATKIGPFIKRLRRRERPMLPGSRYFGYLIFEGSLKNIIKYNGIWFEPKIHQSWLNMVNHIWKKINQMNNPLLWIVTNVKFWRTIDCRYQIFPIAGPEKYSLRSNTILPENITGTWQHWKGRRGEDYQNTPI